MSQAINGGQEWRASRGWIERGRRASGQESVELIWNVINMNSFVSLSLQIVAWIGGVAACIEVLITSDVAPNIHLELITTLLRMSTWLTTSTTRMIIFTFGCIRWTWIFLPRVISHLHHRHTNTRHHTQHHWFYLRLATWSLHLKLRVISQEQTPSLRVFSEAQKLLEMASTRGNVYWLRRMDHTVDVWSSTRKWFWPLPIVSSPPLKRK